MKKTLCFVLLLTFILSALGGCYPLGFNSGSGSDSGTGGFSGPSACENNYQKAIDGLIRAEIADTANYSWQAKDVYEQNGYLVVEVFYQEPLEDGRTYFFEGAVFIHNPNGRCEVDYHEVNKEWYEEGNSGSGSGSGSSGDINDKEFSEYNDEELFALGYSEEELYDMGGHAGYEIGNEDGFLGEEYCNGCDSNSETYSSGYADGYDMGYFEGQEGFLELVYSSECGVYAVAYDTGEANAYNHAIRGWGYNDVFYNEMLNEDEEFVQGYQDGYASGYQQGMDEVDNNGGDANNGWNDEGDNNNGGSGVGIKYTDAFLDFRIYERGYHTIRSEVEGYEQNGLEAVGYVLYFWGPMNDVEPEDLALYYEDTIDMREEELTNRGGLALWGDVYVYSSYFVSPSGEPSLEEFREWRIYDEPGLELKYLNNNALAQVSFDMYHQFEQFFNVDAYPTVILLDKNYRTINRYEGQAPIDQIIDNVFDKYYS